MYESLWAVVTTIGDPRIWLSMIAVLLMAYFATKGDKDRRRESKLIKRFLLLLIPVLLISFLGSGLLKLVFQVPRPCIPCPAPGCNVYCLDSFSFPSSHATTTAGVATALVLLLRRRRYLFIYAFPVLVAVSRVALGVHTVADVTAGLAVGTLITLVIWRYRKIIYKWEDEIL